MSKIFEVLHKTHTGLGEALTPPTPEEIAREEAAASSAPSPAVQADAPGAAPGPAQAPPPDAVPAGGPRQVSLRVSATAPVLPFEDNRHAAEEYRLLRTKILQHPRQPKLIVVSSSGSGDGKSTTAINLAGALSLKDDARVVLVDADFRRPAMAAELGIPSAPGLSDVLAGSCALEDTIVQAEEYPNLFIIPAGEPQRNPGELLDSPRWPAICAQLRADFRHVIVDSPPIAAVADYDLLSAVSDGVIVVVRPDHTNKKLCYTALESIPREKVLGIVVNCVPDWFLSDSRSYNGYYTDKK